MDIDKIIKEEVEKFLMKQKKECPLCGGSLKDLAMRAQAGIWNFWRNRNCGPNSRKLYPGEIHYKCANFEGPGTRMDLKSVRDKQPINSIDDCAKTHDQAYYAIFKALNDKVVTKEEAQKLIRSADKAILQCFEDSKKEPGYYEAGKAGIMAKMALEKVAGKNTKLKKLLESSIGPYLGSD